MCTEKISFFSLFSRFSVSFLFNPGTDPECFFFLFTDWTLNPDNTHCDELRTYISHLALSDLFIFAFRKKYGQPCFRFLLVSIETHKNLVSCAAYCLYIWLRYFFSCWFLLYFFFFSKSFFGSVNVLFLYFLIISSYTINSFVFISRNRYPFRFQNLPSHIFLFEIWRLV